MKLNFQNITYSVPWNLFLITQGSIILAIGLKSIILVLTLPISRLK
jgi:hypothetical protein